MTKHELIDVSTHEDKPETVFIDGPIKTTPPLYLPVMWANVLPTFQCVACGHCDPDKDEMILHVLTHVPERDREKLMVELLKETK